MRLQLELLQWTESLLICARQWTLSVCVSIHETQTSEFKLILFASLPDIYVFVQDRQTLNSSVGSVIEARKRLKFVKRSI